LKRFIKQSLSEIEEVQGESVDIEVIHESYAELMAANKDLIELHDEVEEYQRLQSSSCDVLVLQELADIREMMQSGGAGLQQFKLSLMHQLVRLAERAQFTINLDYLRWLISYGWNLGIQKYRQGGVGVQEESKIYIQFCYSLVEQLKVIKGRELAKKDSNKSSWETFGIFLDMVGPKMEEANEKLMY
jgi:hypothetical protein